MGIVYSKITLRNPRLPRIEPIEVNALADSGAVFLCIPEALRSRLELEQVSDQTVTIADGSSLPAQSSSATRS